MRGAAGAGLATAPAGSGNSETSKRVKGITACREPLVKERRTKEAARGEGKRRSTASSVSLRKSESTVSKRLPSAEVSIR
ncbi:hypothetical protein D3C86_1406620 [compost metagenome]